MERRTSPRDAAFLIFAIRSVWLVTLREMCSSVVATPQVLRPERARPSSPEARVTLVPGSRPMFANAQRAGHGLRFERARYRALAMPSRVLVSYCG